MATGIQPRFRSGCGFQGATLKRRRILRTVEVTIETEEKTVLKRGRDRRSGLPVVSGLPWGEIEMAAGPARSRESAPSKANKSSRARNAHSSITYKGEMS